MSHVGVGAGRTAPVFRSSMPGVVWPAIAGRRSALLQALLMQLEGSQWFPEELLAQQQLSQLRVLLTHAANTVPGYQTLLSGYNLAALTWAEFAELPRLTRSDIQSGGDDFFSLGSPESHGPVSSATSSGSTGQPIKSRSTALEQLFQQAITLRDHLWHQRVFTAKFAAIRVKAPAASHPDWGMPVSDVFESGPAVTLDVSESVSAQLEWLIKESPRYLLTHVNNLKELATLSLKKGQRIPSLVEVRTFSETLNDDVRQWVREAWDVPIVDLYSCTEAGTIALQCPDHEHYHAQSESVLVEILRPDGSACSPGEVGEVVLTTLHNFAMPLIRYRIGDFAEMGARCSCGRSLPVLKRIMGRTRNMLRLPNGTTHWPSFPGGAWVAVAPIAQFQVTQTTLDKLHVRYVMDRDLASDEEDRLRLMLHSRLQYPFVTTFERVPQIPRRVAHKFEDFLSDVPWPLPNAIGSNR